MRIGVFDSGIGGLTVLKSLIKNYPNNEYLYYGDTINLPYGEKTKEQLLELTTKIIKFFEEKKVDLIIIACGTVSASCYLELKKITSIPIYDIISPTINYLKNLNLNKIAIFATKRTIDSKLFNKELKEKEVLGIATSEFVPMIENKKIDLEIIKNYCLKVQDYDVLVLGCTHYPLIQDKIEEYLNSKTIVINMANCLLKSIKLTNNNIPKVSLYFTKLDETLKDNVNYILENSYELNLIK